MSNIKHATEVLKLALANIARNKASRDTPEGEPSLALAAAIYTTLTGDAMTQRNMALAQLAVKLARMVRDPQHQDSYIDGAAYLAMAYEPGDVSALAFDYPTKTMSADEFVTRHLNATPAPAPQPSPAEREREKS